MGKDYDSDYGTCLDVARSIALSPLDDVRSEDRSSIDNETREAARAFLRSEFERWQTAEGEAEEPEEREQ